MPRLGSWLLALVFLQATRSDLLLPVDTQYTNNFAFLSLKELKIRLQQRDISAQNWTFLTCYW